MTLKDSTRELIERVPYGGYYRLKAHAIDKVFINELPSAQYAPDYAERASRYLITLKGEKRRRRVYATPIGNVSVLYIKIKGSEVYCESALDSALYRNMGE